eukprot:CAMPEP_0194126002 /NCGR_PEP_ID=MMETSP0150-20130528/59760_1 /TAXON_ID=122233 /ORGANISM="Chaetoceros debilis, Strain MM31A-1" /LENGTH=551 /DNA_ID=CAMNT_0038819841 /DNA_START=63 /DNA_END=1718 /DNA_ORIENTATION=+
MGKKSKRVRKKGHQQLKSAFSSLEVTSTNNKYVVARTDFKHIPRWPNDGIEQEVSNKDVDHIVNDPINIAFREAVGFCPTPLPLSQNDPESRDFVLSLPHMMQSQTAEEQSDLSSAKEYLIAAYKRKDPKVMLLLREINCKTAVYKASCDNGRFPDFRYFIVPLFQKNLASDENIELLFGKVSHVRHLLLEIGSQVAEPPPSNSPAGAHLSQFLYKEDEKVAPGQKACAECGILSEDNVKCSACKSVHYCSRDCQRKHWTIHKPDCLAAQGKLVPKSVLQKARNVQTEKDERKAELEAQKQEDLNNDFVERYEKFVHEPPDLCDSWAHCCRGKRLRVHVPTVNAINMIELSAILLKKVQTLSLGMYPDGIDDTMYGFRGLELENCCRGKRLRVHVPTMIANNMIEFSAMHDAKLKKVQTLSLGMYPDGIDDSMYGFRGLELENLDNKARIIVLFERLFEGEGNGVGCGLHIDGIFVVDKVVKRRAKWRLVREPLELYKANDNRNERLIKYAQLAKHEAKPVPETVDLGIHNPGDPDLSVMSTAFGDHVSVK